MTVKARKDALKTTHIDYSSVIDNQRYTGNFTFKKLSIRDLAALGVRKTQLNGGLHHDPANPGRGVDEQTDEFNGMIAHLELCIVEAPPWWNLDQISDVELVGKLYQEAMTFENSFLRRGQGTANLEGSQPSGDSQAGREAAGKASDVPGAASEVVGREVQAALEP